MLGKRRTLMSQAPLRQHLRFSQPHPSLVSAPAVLCGPLLTVPRLKGHRGLLTTHLPPQAGVNAKTQKALGVCLWLTHVKHLSTGSQSPPGKLLTKGETANKFFPLSPCRWTVLTCSLCDLGGQSCGIEQLSSLGSHQLDNVVS